MGGSRGRRQAAAEKTAAGAVTQEQAGAKQLQDQLDQRRAIIGTTLPQAIDTTQTGAENLRATGGYVSPTQEDLDKRGYGGYQELATTGGFNPGEKEAFLRRATAPTEAIYSRATDEMGRQKALQGGYSPGFSSAQDQLTRSAAQSGAEASLAGNIDLARQIREGKTTGLAGMAGVRQQAGQEQLGVAQGRIAGQDALQKFTQFGSSALNDIDIISLRNRMQTGAMSMADSDLLKQLAAQDKTLFDKIMEGIKTIGGATAGIGTGIGAATGTGAH